MDTSGLSDSLDNKINIVDGYLLTLIPRSVAEAEQGGGEVPACFTLSIPLHEDVGDVVAGALQDTGLNNLREK